MYEKEVDKVVKAVLLDHLKFRKEVEASKESQEQIAENLGISDRHVRNLQTKNRPISAYLLYQMSIVFHKPMEYFLLILEED
jgi:transcriptional regulator with XRE-family HTH domain